MSLRNRSRYPMGKQYAGIVATKSSSAPRTLRRTLYKLSCSPRLETSAQTFFTLIASGDVGEPTTAGKQSCMKPQHCPTHVK